MSGRDIPVRGPVQFEMVNIYGRKINQGIPGPDDHPVNSTIIQGSWEGGGQLERANPASDMQRFQWATLMSEYPNALTLPPLTEEYTGPNSGPSIICLGDFPFSDGGDMFFAWGGRLVKYNSSANNMTDVTALAVTPPNPGTVYTLQSGGNAGQTWFFIPGSSTYAVWKGATFETPIASEPAIEFAVWDNKLFKLGNDGKVKWTTDHVSWTLVGQIPDGSNPRHLINYLNRQDDRQLHVITNTAVWALDFAAATLVRSWLDYPRHPQQGHAVTLMKNELWTSSGIGIYAYNLSSIVARGLDHDQGLPVDYSGNIVSMSQGLNNVFALIKGANVGSSVPEGYTLDLGGGDDQTYMSVLQANAVLMAWNGRGWHFRWAGAGANVGNVYVSQANSLYNLWWTNNGKAYRQTLPITYFNAADPASAGFKFAQVGYLQTPWYNWGWEGQPKLLKKIEAGVKNISTLETIDVYIKYDKDTNPFTLIGTIKKNAETDPEIEEVGFFLGQDPLDPLLPDGKPKYRGVRHERFRLKFVLNRRTTGTDPETYHPVMLWWAAIGRQILRPVRSWRFTGDFTLPNRGDFPHDSMWFLEKLSIDGEAQQFEINGHTYMVEVVALAGPEDVHSTGSPGFRSIHLIESNEAEYAGHFHGVE